ncbi:MAG: hypothetical protein RBU45_03695 [Myxococcota bacterium]|nr:hypothetical protein [Myxococcota bacterium]
MAESKAEERTADRARGIGDFNKGGKVLNSKDVEFYKKNGKIFVRNRSQTTKDREQMKKEGKDPDSTKRDSIKKDAKISLKAEKKVESEKLLGTKKDEPATLAQGKGGKLEGEYTVGQAEAGVSAEASYGTDGVEVNCGAAVKVTLVGGKLTYTMPEFEFTLGGQQLKLAFGAQLEASVAAEAQGKVAIKAKQDGGKVKIGAEAGGEAFAGAKAGFALFGKFVWKDPKDGKDVDVVAASAGVEGWAGAAAAAKISCQLAPSIKANAYFGAAVGIGAAVKATVEINAIAAARLGYILACKGIPAALQGLEAFGRQTAEWIKSGAHAVVDTGKAAWEKTKNVAADVWEYLGW